MHTKHAAVEVTGLTVAYDDKPVLWDIALSIPHGSLAAVIGPNGAGKTTLIKAMLGLVPTLSGQTRFYSAGGEDITQIKKRVGYVPQSGSVDWDFPATVLDIVMMGRYGHLGWIKRPGRQDKEMAMETLKKVGMADFAGRQISQLSGGQQQRVFLARALVQQADIYLMDEPFKGVDAQTERAIVALLKELSAMGKTVVVVHHDLQTVTQYFNWVVLINRLVTAAGPVGDVFVEKNIGVTYLSNGAMLQGAL